jgi:hypothetical protein
VTGGGLFEGNISAPQPATLVVGTAGRVKSRFIDPDYRKRMEIEGLIASLRT